MIGMIFAILAAFLLQSGDLSELISNADAVLPAAALVFVYGAVEVVKVLFYKKNGPSASLPWWFPLVPGMLGLAYGVFDFFVLTPTPDLQLLTITKRILGALKMGLGYGGASILIYQLKKGWQDTRNVPPPPPQG